MRKTWSIHCNATGEHLGVVEAYTEKEARVMAWNRYGRRPAGFYLDYQGRA